MLKWDRPVVLLWGVLVLIVGVGLVAKVVIDAQFRDETLAKEIDWRYTKVETCENLIMWK